MGPFVYRLTESRRDWEDLPDSAQTDNWGYTDHASATIHLQPDMNPALKRTIALHEILHACAFAGGSVTSAKRGEEEWVTTTAPMLLDAMTRSPGLAAFLSGGGR